MNSSGLLIAFSLGLFSTLHCWGMCGGIITALSMGLPDRIRNDRSRLLLYSGAFNIGRISSYTLAGLVAGTAGGVITLGGSGIGFSILQIMAGLVLVFAGLQLAGWARGIAVLERAGRFIWSYLQPLGRGLLPADRAHKAFLMGMIWGGLPCGLVYSALLFALASGHTLSGGGIMLAFGLGTLPGMISAGFVGGRFQHWLRQPYLRQAAGIILIVAGVAVPLLHVTLPHQAGTHDHAAIGHSHQHQSAGDPADHHP